MCDKVIYPGVGVGEYLVGSDFNEGKFSPCDIVSVEHSEIR